MYRCFGSSGLPRNAGLDVLQWKHIRRQVQNLKELDRELVAFSESLPALYKPDGGEKSRELLKRRWPNHDLNRSKDRESTSGSVHGEETGEATRSATNGQPSKLGEEPGVYPFLALHRLMINTEIQYVQIALHRPYVLRMGEKYDPARTACFDAARIDCRCRDVLDVRLLGRITTPVATTWAVCIDYLSPYPISAQPDHIPTHLLARLWFSTSPFYSTRPVRTPQNCAVVLMIQSAKGVASAREVKIIQLFRAKADNAPRLGLPMKPRSAHK
ncbi:hypothetical protein FRC08_002650 [Ceratobasidium sp. 394]|nr:hypothetical protein FRC08_002650 [Ceratobasidium sp. 394]